MNAKIKWLLRLYPRRWRERYEDEFVAMLEQRPVTFVDALDIVLGAIDARLNPQLVNGRVVPMSYRMRAATITVLCAYVGFVVAGMGFQKATEDPPFVELENTYILLGISYDAIVAGALVALVAMAIGGAAIVLAVLRWATSERRRDIPLLFAVPPLSLAVFIGYVLLLTGPVYSAVGPLAIHDPLNVALALSLVGLFLILAVGSTAAVSIAVVRSGIDARFYRFALVPGAVATAAMGAIAASTVVWGLSLWANAPQLFNENGGILSTNFAASWLGVVVAMVLSTCVAGIWVVRGLTAARATRDAARQAPAD